MIFYDTIMIWENITYTIREPIIIYVLYNFSIKFLKRKKNKLAVSADKVALMYQNTDVSPNTQNHIDVRRLL